MEKIETVARDCHKTDCIYRSHIFGGLTPICYYAAIEHQVRGCKISECTRYRGGKPKKPTIDSEYVLYWEYEYGEDDNSLW